MTLAEQELFESFLRKPGPHNHWYPIFTVMLWTGMRVGEITGLRWCDIDLESETISVNYTLVFYSKGEKAMQEILGHADAETTMDIYAEALWIFSVLS